MEVSVWAKLNSLVVAAEVWWSASTCNQDMIPCFLAFQMTKESLRNIQNIVVDLPESKREPQSAFNWKEDNVAKKIPLP